MLEYHNEFQMNFHHKLDILIEFGTLEFAFLNIFKKTLNTYLILKIKLIHIPAFIGISKHFFKRQYLQQARSFSFMSQFFLPSLHL